MGISTKVKHLLERIFRFQVSTYWKYDAHGTMNLGTIARYQLGHRGAVVEAASSRSALAAGGLLVLITAIARSYDQTLLLESPFAFVRPFVFSLISAVFVYTCLYRPVFVPAIGGGSGVSYWRGFESFLALFWLTAPIAWLYAIPVERFLEPEGAARANIALLSVVAAWRVVLLGRVLSVLLGAPLQRAIGWVLLPACVEVFVLGIFGPAFGGSGAAILAGMSGRRNSPEEDVLLGALGIAVTGALVLFVVVGLALKFTRYEPVPRAMPRRAAAGFPLGLLVVALAWAAVAVEPQREVQRTLEVTKLLRAERYRDAIAFLSRYGRGDFSPVDRIPPDPYRIGVFKDLPGVFAALDGSEPGWVRETYLALRDPHKIKIIRRRSVAHCDVNVEGQCVIGCG